jgi:crotonobetainyl-CoA:carnitine CoA-transferase CaiB-like acyl-CoA transferase
MTATTGPLAGVRVLDLSRVLAGPFCTMVLGDLGADVIKIEQPGRGDDTRAWGPPFAGSESAYYLSVNRNKRGIAVDFKPAAGRKVIRDLAARSDVLIENFRPGTLERLGLGYDDLRVSNPRLIYCSISGFGHDGPGYDRPGLDVIVAAAGGLLGITGEEGRPPVKPGVARIDIATARYAASAINAALYARQASDHLPPLLRLHVDGHAALVAVDREVIGALASDEMRRQAARHVAFRRLDLDHLGTEIAQDLRRIGPGQKLRQVEHAQMR